jgi:phosphomannomutase
LHIYDKVSPTQAVLFTRAGVSATIDPASLQQKTLTVDEIFIDLPNSISTPEIKIQIHDNEKFQFMQQFIQQAYFEDAHTNTIDGLRVDFPNGWGLIRPSNTTPCLVLRFEADEQTTLQHIQNLFRQELLKINPDLKIPF